MDKSRLGAQHSNRNTAAIIGGDGSSAGQSANIFNDGQIETRFDAILGAAVVELWGDLPVGIQEALFEHAVLLGHQSERDEMLREQLAKFLHDRHKRTVDAK